MGQGLDLSRPLTEGEGQKTVGQPHPCSFRTGLSWFAAFLVVSASVLPLPSAHKDSGQPPLAPGASALQVSKRTLLALGALAKPSDEIFPLLGGELEASKRRAEAEALSEGASRKRAEALSQQTAGGQELPEAMSLDSPSHQLTRLGTTKVSGKATPGPATSALTKSQSESSVTEPTDKTLSSGSLKITAILQPWASSVHGPGKNFKAPGSSVTVQAPTSTTLRASATPRPIQESSRALLVSITPVPLVETPQSLAWLPARHIPSPSVQMPSAVTTGFIGPEASLSLTLAPRGPEKAVSSAPPGRLESASMASTQPATEPPPPAVPGWSGLDPTSPTLAAGSGPPRAAVTSGLGPSGTLGLLPSAVPSFSPQPSAALPLSPSPSAMSLSLSLSLPPTSPSPVLAPVSSLTTRVGSPPAGSESALVPSTPDSSLTPALPPLMVPQSDTPQGTVQPGWRVFASPAPTATLSLSSSSSLPSTAPSSGSPGVPVGADPTQSSALPHPGQAVSLQDSMSSAPEPRHITHSVTFRITSETFSAALWNPVSLEHRLLSGRIRDKLQSIYHKAFPSFQGAHVLEFRPGSVAVNASLVFGGQPPGPSAQEILWILYRHVKASRGMLGHLFLDESSLTASGSTLTDLALETICISFTAMRPFLPQLVLPGSDSFALLEDQILHLVTPVVSRFYKEPPQEGPLLLFSNVNQWVRVYMEYKFRNSIPTHLRGLANHLAHSIMDPILQKSSIVANGEKAELVLCEMWLKILSQPFTKALKNKTSPESQKLRQQLTRWVQWGLRPLQNFGQVVVEEFQPEPLTAKVGAIFFGATPAQALIQDSVRQALYLLWKDEGLWGELVTLALGQCLATSCRAFPSVHGLHPSVSSLGL
ncbi:Taste receptor cell protein 1 [Sciurus carolinensis]|uniref:Taste receptor cell protein 1 n=1 Tax=Sciurus carolinensis TaxID=30640 RepID=A0AA41T3K1_SCICA|nr:Taste receptor cell protein 1 [Sciurus carolinensis]